MAEEIKSIGVITLFVLAVLVMGSGALLATSKAIEPSEFYWASGGLFCLGTFLAIRDSGFSGFSLRL